MDTGGNLTDRIGWGQLSQAKWQALEAFLIDSIVKHEIIQFSGLRKLNGLPRCVVPLQSEQAVHQINIGGDIVRSEVETLPISSKSILMLALKQVSVAQMKMCPVIARIGLDFLLIRLRCFLQFSGHVAIVVSGDNQFLPLAGMVSQFECLGE